ncbi:hypothetical protein FA15DRAFT_3028 [Coprinopsis marcescibilis]|uniref:Uncharacterized protein n=1 Tax=Coprinopsis marcescibilis TaxID=230819 RepID=A0A5C3LCI7_COPMA|nr:hypothetical protein FA15DRAFT_3028 [Coprinopsis marcescibilis]
MCASRHACSSKEASNVHERNSAARVIQGAWRNRSNQAKTQYLTPDARWEDGLANAKLKLDRQDAFEGRNSPRRRWKRATSMIRDTLKDENTMLTGRGVQIDSEYLESKALETQHWLEMVDGFAPLTGSTGMGRI